ncbi:MAG: ABC transporter ATP-binding protein [Methylophilaceae bacterium]
MAVAVEFIGVEKRFGNTVALQNVNFSVDQGEFFAMLGPSGSGKTTCLRLIAGFDFPTQGAIQLEGKDISALPPFQRPVNTVFQDYALFPHMSVLDNVAYSLMIAKEDKTKREKKAQDLLDMVRLGAMAKRRPSELSGGQRQRVALARALAKQPKILLLDEPLGALDLKLREAMQAELKQLHKELGLTFILVTHDQGEALSMADRVAVFNEGRIEQIDTPQALYNQPKTPFVARFVGSANVLSGKVVGAKNEIAIRPEYIRLGVLNSGEKIRAKHVGLPVTIVATLYLGALTRVDCATADGTALSAHIASSDIMLGKLASGQQAYAYWLPEHMVNLA